MRIPRRLILALPFAALAACTATWSPQPLPEGPEPIAGPVRVTYTSGERRQLIHVQVLGDSLYGERADVPSHPRVAIAVADVHRIDTVKGSDSGTAVLTVVALLAFWFGYLRPRLLAD